MTGNNFSFNLIENLTGVFIQFYQQFDSALGLFYSSNVFFAYWKFENLVLNLTEDLTGVWEYL